METAIIAAVIAFAAVMITLMAAVVRGTWLLRTEIGKIQVEMAALQVSFSRELARHQTQDDEQFAIVRREFGETITAIRHGVSQVELSFANKVNGVEKEHRDLFIRRESFLEVVRGIREENALLRQDIRDLIQRTDNHLAALAGRPIVVQQSAPSESINGG